MANEIYTIGHSTRSAAALVALLREFAVALVVDVRTVPRSRANPQFNAEILPQTLAEAAIGYCPMRELGGLRGKARPAAPASNALWRNDAFRNYADYALTGAFRDGLMRLVALAAARRPAIMCAEAVWWRCHRRIIADHLLALGTPVLHIMAPGKAEPARMTPGAVLLPEGGVAYPAAEDGAGAGAGG